MTRPPEFRAYLEPDEIVVDSFAGGGGASEGIRLALGRGPDIAINHDAEAIALHAANHPETEHYREDVWKVDPVKACAGRRVGLMWLSPDCKHFSKAKGGKPVSKRVRGLAWVAVRWAKAVKPRVIVLENVEEFQSWGPVLRATNMPCPKRRGETYRAFRRKLQREGYVVDARELRACDYGAPTIRKRLFLIARCDGQPIVWPAPTHGKHRPLPWRTAAECIDFSIECPSIFGRKKPLAENTLKRIGAGLRRFVFEADKPFIINMAHGGKLEPLGKPLSTIATEKGGCRAIVEPYLVPLTHHGNDARVESLSEPMKTVTGAHRGETALISPTLIQAGYGEREGQSPRAPGLDKPLGTVVAGGTKHALVTAFMAQNNTGNVGHQMEFPMSTIVQKGCTQSLVTSALVNMRGTAESQLVGRSIEEPLPTISGGGIHAAEVRAFLVAYFGNERDGISLFDPMRTVTSRDRFGLVTVEGVDYELVDIGLRMLVPRELYRAQGFRDSYKIDIEFNGKPLSKTAQVRMCGNSVCPDLAHALVRANVGTRLASEVAA